MRRFPEILILLLLPVLGSCSKDCTLVSPNREICVAASIEGNKAAIAASVDGSPLFSISDIGLARDYNEEPLAVSRVRRSSVREILKPTVSRKSEVLSNEYNSLKVAFGCGKELEIRAFDNAVAYRWIVRGGNESNISDETAIFDFGGDATVWYPNENSFYSANEVKYTKTAMGELGPGKLASLPVLFAQPSMKYLVAESNLLDYAGMWLESAEDGSMKAVFPKYPKVVERVGDRDEFVRDREDFISIFSKRAILPWRIVSLAKEDKDLLSNTIVYQLADPSKGDYSWVKPGKAQWDWWNDWNISGVDFTPGVNTDTYRYYIDFAAANGIEYVVFDEGWSSSDSLLSVNPNVDVEGLIKYASTKNVRVVLWCTWLRLDECLEEALSKFEEWGAAAIKVDFMSRDDQPMVNYYTRVAKTASEHKLMVDFHGCYRPTGLDRTYPNVVSFEGVYGLEQSKADQSKYIGPDHNLVIPFTRMVVGPMDYTPGAVCNAHKEQWQPDWHSPMGMGTRCHHMAMFVVYESPLQMMCDSPMHYQDEKACYDFIKSVPTVWKQSVPLCAEVGEYLAVARESFDGRWFIGAMTNSSEREMRLNLDFLAEGDYIATAFCDGPDAGENANDFAVRKFEVRKGAELDVRMSREGGYVVVLDKK